MCGFYETLAGPVAFDQRHFNCAGLSTCCGIVSVGQSLVIVFKLLMIGNPTELIHLPQFPASVSGDDTASFQVWKPWHLGKITAIFLRTFPANVESGANFSVSTYSTILIPS